MIDRFNCERAVPCCAVGSAGVAVAAFVAAGGGRPDGAVADGVVLAMEIDMVFLLGRTSAGSE